MRRALVHSAIVLWGFSLSAGFALVERHAAVAAMPASGLRSWPANTALSRSPHGATLLGFIHPRCPCSRATLRQLERVLSRSPYARVEVIYRDDPGADLHATDAWALGARIPGARRVIDRGGVEARRFGARISGEVMLFDATGALRFHGGVTPSRGHEGDNEGAEALDAALRGASEGFVVARIFGCEL
jgi:hypothetical protein